MPELTSQLGLKERHPRHDPTATSPSNPPSSSSNSRIIHPRLPLNCHADPHPPKRQSRPPAGDSTKSPPSQRPQRRPSPLHQIATPAGGRQTHRLRRTHRLRQHHDPLQPARRAASFSTRCRRAMGLRAASPWARDRQPGRRNGQVHKWAVPLEHPPCGGAAGPAG